MIIWYRFDIFPFLIRIYPNTIKKSILCPYYRNVVITSIGRLKAVHCMSKRHSLIVNKTETSEWDVLWTSKEYPEGCAVWVYICYTFADMKIGHIMNTILLLIVLIYSTDKIGWTDSGNNYKWKLVRIVLLLYI